MHTFGYGSEGYNHGPHQSAIVNNHWIAPTPEDYSDYIDEGRNEPSDSYSVAFKEVPDAVDETSSQDFHPILDPRSLRTVCQLIEVIRISRELDVAASPPHEGPAGRHSENHNLS